VRQDWLVVVAPGVEETVVEAGALEAVLVPDEADELPEEDELPVPDDVPPLPLDEEDVPLLVVVAV
jgi:hypothetical protein